MRGGANRGRGNRSGTKPCPTCFVGGTEVQAESGGKPIETIQVDELVLAADTAENGEPNRGQTRREKVKQLFTRVAPAVLDISVGGEKLSVTPEHEIWVEGEGWRPARELWVGARLLTKDGKSVKVEYIGKREGEFQVYNFEVANEHTYFVGRQGLLVHNACPNPNGKKGGQAHQQTVQDVITDVKSRGLEPDVEHMVETPAGRKSRRFVDVVGVDKNGNVIEMHQVGKQNKNGTAVSRERSAINDILDATGSLPKFHPYNKP
jgi:hypothetical protein